MSQLKIFELTERSTYLLFILINSITDSHKGSYIRLDEYLFVTDLLFDFSRPMCILNYHIKNI